MAKNKTKTLAEIHAQAVTEFDTIMSTARDERDQAIEDRRFATIAGAQWEGNLGQQFDNKPRMEVNKVLKSVMRVTNEYRNNRITVDFIPKDGKEADKLADVCDGLYRSDEQDCTANEAYDNAFEEGVLGGYGAWRLTSEYEDEYDDDNDEQRIRIEPIYDADACVFWDLGAKRQDKKDAMYCFVLSSMTKEAYREEWDDEPDSWDTLVTEREFDWSTDDMVYVAEYYKVEIKPETVHIYETIDGEEQRYTDTDFEHDEELEEFLITVGTTKTGEKKVKRRKVHKYIMSGGSVLEDCKYIAGDQIPVVPYFAKRWYVDNIERCMGHVRLAKDAQRLKNMQLSKLAEFSALSTVEKPIFAPEQMDDRIAHLWGTDNVENYPYLLAKPVTDAEGNSISTGPIGYTKPPQIPQALAALLQLTESDMTDILGNQEAGEEITPNISGKAVELIQNRLDMQSYIYMDNMAKAMRRSGEIWLSMAKDLYVEDGRKMKSVGKENEVSVVELNQPAVDSDTGVPTYDNDLKDAKFEISVSVGPSSSSKRAATVRALTGMSTATSDPQTKLILSLLAMMNMEGEGIDDVRPFFRKQLINLGALEPTEEEAQELAEKAQNTPPDANQTYLMAEAANAQAKAQKAQADTAKAVAETEETYAKTAEILAGIDRDDQKTAVETAQAIGQGLQNISETQGEQIPPAQL